jgi:glutamate synthase (NADPH/NADH) large chain
VIEGSGDHACEYMTGGAVIVLGDTGVNFGAGMTGGLAFVYDKDKLLKNKINTQSVEIKELSAKNFKEHQIFLLNLIKEHFNETKSLTAEKIINNFKNEIKRFVMVKSKDSSFNDILNILTKAA